jgi:hypothetical protein
MTLTVIEGSFGKTGEVVDLYAADTAATVAYLEEAIRLAKLNGAVSCAVIMLTSEGAVLDGWSAMETRSRPYVMVGALAALQRRYMDKNIEQR